jgi:hypothetical protein
VTVDGGGSGGIFVVDPEKAVLRIGEMIQNARRKLLNCLVMPEASAKRSGMGRLVEPARPRLLRPAKSVSRRIDPYGRFL